MSKRITGIMIFLFASIVFCFAGNQALLINATDYDMFYAYATVSGQNNWSSDLLVNDILDAGDKVIVDLPFSSKNVDFKLIDEDSDEYYISSVNLAQSSKVIITMDYLAISSYEDASDGNLRVSNNTGYTIYYLYSSLEGQNNWSDDLFGSSVLYDGDSLSVNLPDDDGYYDLQFVDEDGDSYYLYNINPFWDEVVTVNFSDLDNYNGYEEEYTSTVNVTVKNDTGYSIYYLYASPEYAEDWSDDLLGSEILSDGDSMRIQIPCEPGDCIFDFKAIDVDDDEYFRWNYDICKQNNRIIFTFSDLSYEEDEIDYEDSAESNYFDVQVANDTGYDIWYLYSSASYEDNDWGEDLLGSSILYDGESIDVSVLQEDSNNCEFNFSAVDEDDDEYFLWNVNLCDESSIVLRLSDLGSESNYYEDEYTESSDTVSSLTIDNNTGYTIYSIFVSESNSSSWGEDYLGDTPLYSGNSINLDLDSTDECIYDLKLVDEDEDTYTRYSVDLCAASRQVFTISDLD